MIINLNLSKILWAFLLLHSVQIYAQEIEYNKFSTAINISSEKALFANRNFVDSLVGDKRIILLGELDHGDGLSFELKTKMIKYLHENHGFNTLVFETGLINCDALMNEGQQKGALVSLAKDHIYYIWSEVSETKELFNYIEKQKNKDQSLKLIGIDPQFSGKLGYNAFIQILLDHLSQDQINNERFKEFSHELKLISEWLKYPEKGTHIIDEATFQKHIDFYENYLSSQDGSDYKSKWKNYFENIRTLAKIKWQKRKGSFEIRDKQMFNNLKYYLDQNKNEKVIVWAANAHTIRRDKELKGKDSDYFIIGLKKFGDYVYEAYSETMYSIAVAARKGKTLNYLDKTRLTKIKRAGKNSLEENLKNLDLSLVDLSLYEDAKQLEEYPSHLFYPNIKCISKWSNHFDGVFYFQKMNPSTPNW